MTSHAYESGDISPEETDQENEMIEPLQHDEQHTSSPDSISPTTTSYNRKRARSSTSRSQSWSESEPDSESQGSGAYTAERIRRDAAAWAAQFTGPENGIVKSPHRQPPGSRSLKRITMAPSKARARRLRGFYSKEYQSLINMDIRDATRRITRDEEVSDERHQIGISIWTPQEKDMFFASLSRLGRNARGISLRIGTKSELEVQDYLRLLHMTLAERNELRYQFHINDVPAALELSGECTEVLERAGDALASRLEQIEEDVEQGRWGEEWLLTSDVCKWLTYKRNQDGGEDTVNKILPAVNLLNLKNWLALSAGIFMNPAAPREDDNWQKLAEPNEEPSIRATAFGDFHSLVVNLTRRLVSTVLFCTASRMRSLESKKTKAAQITAVDVEAAVRILGLPANSREYWARCARRCNLEVYTDNLEGDEEEICLSYDDVEAALTGRVSTSDQQTHHGNTKISSEFVDDTETDEEFSEEEMDLESEDSESDVQDRFDNEVASQQALEDLDIDEDGEMDGLADLSESDSPEYSSRTERAAKRRRTRKAYEEAQDIYTEAMDQEASRAAERHLWTLLRQAPPFEIKSEVAQHEPPKAASRSMVGSFVNWRANTECRSEWEAMDRPVPREKFSRLGEGQGSPELGRSMRRTRNAAGRDGGLAATSDSESVGDGMGSDSETEDGRDSSEERESGDDAGSHISVSSGLRSTGKQAAVTARASVNPSIKSESDSEYEDM
ncbi:hypothetical protein PVAG01_10075 [Phlyctema vagabunda]|uniref:Uncharacterized protein n=1 Tax=Phlyctema vagabunda TaxID=108571 RepID=A0ABR4P4X1_9HELO